MKLSENVDLGAIKSKRNFQELAQQKNRQLKTRFSKIIADLEGSLKSFEELKFDARKENHLLNIKRMAGTLLVSKSSP